MRLDVHFALFPEFDNGSERGHGFLSDAVLLERFKFFLHVEEPVVLGCLFQGDSLGGILTKKFLH